MNAKLARPSLASKRHPITGKLILPVGYINGRAIWPILGGDDTVKDPDGGAGEGGQEEEGKEAPPTDSGTGTEDTSGDPKRKIAALEEEKDRHFNLRQKAEQERDDLQKRLKSIEDKDKDESTKMTERVGELEKELESAQGRNKQLSLDNAFLKDNTYQWYDPDDALRLADLSAVEIDKDGNVRGLKDALEKLAKSKPHLVKPKEEQNGKGTPPKSGDPAHGQRNKKEELDREALIKKFPALRR